MSGQLPGASASILLAAPAGSHDRFLSPLGLGLDTGLGRKEEAICEARRAVELQPITKASPNGPILVTNLAQVYAWTGERDRALEQLESVATIPNGPTYGRSPPQSVLG